MTDDAYWSDLIDSFEEQEAPPDPASMAADDVSRMLGALRRLNTRLADYDRLHLRELERLDARRAKLVGPLVERIAALERTLRDYGLRAMEDFGKTGTVLATPNGSIKAGRPMVVDLSIKDEAVEPWLRPHAPDAITYKPSVSKADLRWHLEEGVRGSGYRQAIVLDRGTDGVVVIAVVVPPAVWSGEFADDWTGVWIRPTLNDDLAIVWPDVGEVITDPNLLVQGVTWSPVGERGSGRKIVIELG